MANFKSNLYDTTDAGAAVFPTAGPWHHLLRVNFKIVIATATTLTLNDNLLCCPIPLNHMVEGFFIQVPNLDPNAAGTLRFSLGDWANGFAQYLASVPAAMFQNGAAMLSHFTVTGVAAPTAANIVGAVAGNIPTKYTAKNASRIAAAYADDLILRVTATAASATSGAQTVYGYMDFRALSDTTLLD